MAVEEEMKIGPKGQVVTPRLFRKVLKINPGSNVIVRLENDKVVLERKWKLDVAAEFEGIAKSRRSVAKVSPHMYEEEFRKRSDRL